MSANELNSVIAILAPIVSGLAGVVLGARLTRAVEHEKWLRENRSVKFAIFLERLGASRRAATDALFDTSTEGVARDTRVTEAYLPAEEYARVVALYLPKDKRKPFRDLTRNFIALHSQPSLGTSRLLTMETRLEEIQQIFEEEL